MPHSVEVRTLTPCDTAVVRAACRPQDVERAVREALDEVSRYLEASSFEASGIAFARILRDEREAAVEAGYITFGPVPGSGRVQSGALPGGEAAVCLHEGPYARITEAYAAVDAWLEANGRQAREEPWELYLSPPGQQPPLVEVVVALQ